VQPIDIAVRLHDNAGAANVLQLTEPYMKASQLADYLRLALKPLRYIVLAIE
jgi:hypothetical protein